MSPPCDAKAVGASLAPPAGGPCSPIGKRRPRGGCHARGWGVGAVARHRRVPSPVDDLYLGGRLAAQHALSDLYALGLEPRQAWALATVPVASDGLMAADLEQLMAGAEATLTAAGCILAGALP